MSVFVDSTTLLYPLDPNETTKGPVCETWLNRARLSGDLTVNLQVLNEVCSVVLRKPNFEPIRSELNDVIEGYLPHCTATLDAQTTFVALTLRERYRIQWWDALLLASADAAGCTHFLSEDMNDGQAYGGVTVINPFRHSPQDVLGRALP